MRIATLKTLGLVLILALGVASVTWATPVIVNPSFETAPCAAPGQPPYYCTVYYNSSINPGFGWSVKQYADENNSVDWVIWNSTAGRAWAAADGTHSIDLNGMTRGGIYQTISGFEVGKGYTLTFALTGSPYDDLPLTDHLKQLEIFLDGTSLGITHYDIDTHNPVRTNMDWMLVTVSIPAAVVRDGSLVLEFKSLNDGANDYAWGPIIDMVDIQDSDVPEPATISLVAGAGLLALAGALRRKK